MKTGIRLLFALISSLSLAYCQGQPSPLRILEGVWYIDQSPGKTVPKVFSWGTGRTVANGALEIDKKDTNETILLPGMGGPFRITRLAWTSKDTMEMSFYFDRGGFEVNHRIHYESKGNAIWFEDLKAANFIESGPGHVWFRISGPAEK